jgi:ribokinase
MQVIVFGEMSMDLIIHRDAQVSNQRVLRGKNYLFSCGGHGANQAISLSNLGISTGIVGRLGNDSLSVAILESLKRANVDIRGIYIDKKANSGLAILSVDPTRDFEVVAFIEGVNDRINLTDLKRFKSLINFETKIAVFQLGYPIDIIVSAIKYCKSRNIITVLDPTPMLADLPKVLYEVDYFMPNEIEAGKITGINIRNIADAFQAAEIIHQRGASRVVIKLGEQGCIYSTHDQRFHTPAFDVEVTDTIGAGDAFLAGLIKGVLVCNDTETSILWGTAYAALCCTGKGAQSNLVSLKRMKKFLRYGRKKSIALNDELPYQSKFGKMKEFSVVDRRCGIGDAFSMKLD